MSLYNMLFGVSPIADTLLGILNITESEIPRFRDIYIENGKIVIYTRTGGGNRDYYESEQICKGNYPEYFNDGSEIPNGPWNDDLRKIKGYVEDKDDDYDPTYAHFYFNPPDVAKEFISQLESLNATLPNPSERMPTLLQKLQESNSSDPEVKRVEEVMRPTMEKIVEALGKVEKTQP